MAYSRPSTSGGVNIEAWTQETVQSIVSLRFSDPSSPRAIRGTGVTLDIPLDDSQVEPQVDQAHRLRTPHVREPARRDSLKRREALLKGKEGSRRRQRWENDRLIGNPWAEPPLPCDWEVRPTHPVHAVPYFLAPLWDEREARRKIAEARNPAAGPNGGTRSSANLPRELRARLKRSKAAKGMLHDLEEQVRSFIQMWEDKERQLLRDGLADADSSEEEDIVFVGRNGLMRDCHRRTRSHEEQKLERDKLIFDALVSDHGAAFGRWLVHTIGTYYNLRTWSITTGDPARREAYVGIRDDEIRRACREEDTESVLPRPLGGMI